MVEASTQTPARAGQAVGQLFVADFGLEFGEARLELFDFGRAIGMAWRTAAGARRAVKVPFRVGWVDELAAAARHAEKRA